MMLNPDAMGPVSFCKEVTKKMFAKSFEIDSNPRKVGSNSETVARALETERGIEREFLRKGGERGWRMAYFEATGKKNKPEQIGPCSDV